MISSIKRVDKPATMFWTEMSPSDHFVQIYEEERYFVDTLESFTVNGLKNDEAIIIIGTEPHRTALERRLAIRGFDLDEARRDNKYIPLDADDTLSRFLNAGWPDDDKFNDTIRPVIQKARSASPKVRAFGEMVALMWSRGQMAATVRLEHLWNRLLSEEKIPLYCAYPKVSFNDSNIRSLHDVCDAHTHVFI
jgi:hypothetical protein